jgi:hypothetical protein
MGTARERGRAAPLRRYQRPTLNSTMIPSSAASENQATLPCPRGSTMKAASSGPVAEPILPPTWNSDCASPCRPPEAKRATREDSGWNTDDPMPTSDAASSSTGKLDALASSSRPVRVKPMPTASEKGCGRASV